MNSSGLRETCAQQLLDSLKRLQDFTCFIGFDGFVDEIIHVVDKRESAEHFHRIPTIPQFAERIASAAGRSTNIELVNKRTKLGGNGPIMAHALSVLGLKVTYLGNLGYPNLHPVFAELAERAEVHSIAEPCHTDALEFLDGKILFGKSVQLNEITWSNIQSRFGRDRFHRKFSSSDLVAFVNWTMIPYMSEIWEALLHELCPSTGPERRKLFFDLCDPAKRSHEDIRRALDLIVAFGKYFDVILGLNEKEAFEIAKALGMERTDHSPDGVSALATDLLARLPIHTLTVHPVTYAVAITGGKLDLVNGPYIAQPAITTGAGDHFNAGFCVGKLLGFDNLFCLLLGVATSGYYVRHGHTPSVEGLVGLLRDWPVR